MPKQRGGSTQTPEQTRAADAAQAEQQPDEAAPDVRRRLAGRLTPTDLLALQRAVGNRAVGGLLSGAPAGAPLQRALAYDDSWGGWWWSAANRQLWSDINDVFNRIPDLRNQLQALQGPTFDGSPALQRLDDILSALHGKYDPPDVTISLQKAAFLLPILRARNTEAATLIAAVPNRRAQQLQQEQQTLDQLDQRLQALGQNLGFAPADEGIDDAVRTKLQRTLAHHRRSNQLLGQQNVALFSQKTQALEQQYQAAGQTVLLRAQQLKDIAPSSKLIDALKAVIAGLAQSAYPITDRSAALNAQAQALEQLRGRVRQAPPAAALFEQALQPIQAALQPIQAAVKQDVGGALDQPITNLRQSLGALNPHMLSSAQTKQCADHRAALQKALQAVQDFTPDDYKQIPTVPDLLAQGQAFEQQATQRIAELQHAAVAPAVPNQVAGVNAGDLFEGLHTPQAISAVTTYIQAHQAQVEALLPIYEPGLIRQMAADNIVDAKWFTILPTLRQADWGHAPDVSVDLGGAVGEVPVDVEWNHILQVHVNRYATDNGIQDHSFNLRTSFWRDPNATVDDIAAAITACIEDAALQTNVRARYQANANHRLAAVTINNYRIGVRIVQGAAHGTVTVGQFYDNSIAPADTFSQEESVQLSQYMGFKR